ncbi:cytochrome C [Lacihabitans sp. LS3-19]|uniref:PVC-type heme-binding CxxCH protein n=1 Tax=Lacihabitans sp. LS3-19 TaxID=2487335 RepID=UPI0020CE1E54|nr:PVC-type heme-binding CxxCH protein [Lacihabitans sp. LS3-19]MCP9767977.1 cytochrome C [Lacihabitans sp. LS3-19]
MKSLNLLYSIIAFSVLFFYSNLSINKPTESAFYSIPDSLNPLTPAVLSPEQSRLAFHVPDGYHMELVASEPMIKEPVAIAWDGNARMYVAQMETYTQDTDGTGTKEKRSRVMLLEDTDNDGKMDKSSVFIKDLLLPRMILCVNHELLVNETDTYDIYSYKDTNGDGVADVKKPAYILGKEAGGNLEHQRSGLDWNIDNYIYQTYDAVRFRYKNGVLKPDSMPSGSNGQWGLTHDNYGRLFFSRAGGENAGSGFQINPKYGALEFADAYNEQTFNQLWPIISTPDVQGGKPRLNPDSTLNHFTAANGQSIFRGDKLPADLIGDYLICEPVARIIRRAKVINNQGKTQLENVYEKKEFIASTDFYFRPNNTYTGPDGCLYIVDMNRGIIQESNWTPKGSFLRNKIDYYGIGEINQRGRIWRLVHDDFKPGPQPKMLDMPAKSLVKYLDHPNGWWRDNAQKQIIILNDKSVVPALKAMVTGITGVSNLGKIHALWTLEGLNAIDKATLFWALKDPDPQIRKTGIWISEVFLNKNDQTMLAAVGKMINDESYDVRTQILLSLGSNKSVLAKKIVEDILAQNADNQMISSVKKSIDKNQDAKIYGIKLANFAPSERKLILAGADIYKSLCSACHGSDGKGLPTNAAPALRGAKHLNADKDIAIRILMNGLQGPIEGKTYPSVMLAMNDNSDEWIAAVTSYIRYEFVGSSVRVGKSRQSAVVKVEDVKKIREQHADKKEAWSIEELDALSAEMK